MNGLTEQQLLLCSSQVFIGEIRKVLKLSHCDQSVEMAILIALFAQIAGVTVDCPTLETLAAQYNCLPRQSQLPALIYLAVQILQQGGGIPSGAGFVFSGIGTPSITPTTPAAIYIDYTIPDQPSIWEWSNNLWTQFIG